MVLKLHFCDNLQKKKIHCNNYILFVRIKKSPKNKKKE